MTLKMKKNVLTVCFLGFSFGVTASTLEECAKLLPEGHEYKVEITLDVDKTTNEPTFTGSFGVTGGTDTPEGFDIGEFVECAGPLIKSLDIETPTHNE